MVDFANKKYLVLLILFILSTVSISSEDVIINKRKDINDALNQSYSSEYASYPEKQVRIWNLTHEQNGFDDDDNDNQGHRFFLSFDDSLQPEISLLQFSLKGFLLRGLNGKSNRGGEEQLSSESGQHQDDGESSTGGATGGQQPGGEKDDEEEELLQFNTMLQSLDALMSSLEQEIVLVINIDNTLLPSAPEERQRQYLLRHKFTAYALKWHSEKKLRLVFITRTSIAPDNWHFFSENQLPEPDFLISAPFGARHSHQLSIQCSATNPVQTSFLPISATAHASVTATSGGIVFANFLTYVESTLSELPGIFRENNIPAIRIEAYIPHWNSANFRTDSTFPVNVPRSIKNVSVRKTVEDNRQTIQQMVSRKLGPLARVYFSSNNEFTVRFPATYGAITHQLAECMLLSSGTVIASGADFMDWGLFENRASQGYPVQRVILPANANARLVEKSSQITFQSKYSFLIGIVDGLNQAVHDIVHSK